LFTLSLLQLYLFFLLEEWTIHRSRALFCCGALCLSTCRRAPSVCVGSFSILSYFFFSDTPFFFPTKLRSPLLEMPPFAVRWSPRNVLCASPNSSLLILPLCVFPQLLFYFFVVSFSPPAGYLPSLFLSPPLFPSPFFLHVTGPLF